MNATQWDLRIQELSPEVNSLPLKLAQNGETLTDNADGNPVAKSQLLRMPYRLLKEI